MKTTVTKDRNGWTTIRCGELTIIAPTSLDNGKDERVEVRCNGSRVFIESHDDGPLVSKIEYFTEN